ncbi:MAG: type II secretion system secretin GspD [bacterium]
MKQSQIIKFCHSCISISYVLFAYILLLLFILYALFIPNIHTADAKENHNINSENYASYAINNNKGYISLNFRNISIPTLVDFISKVTHKNFIYSGKLQGKITIISAKKISIEEAYKVFLSALSYKGYTVIKRNGIYKIVQSSAARQNALPVNIRNLSGHQFETQIIKLNYMNAQSMANILMPLLSPSANIQSYSLTNSLIITDYASDIRKADKIIKALDIPDYGQKIGVIPVKYAKALKIANILNTIYAGSAAVNYSMINLNSQFVRIIPYKSTNSIIVMASPVNFKKIIKLIQSLDIRSNSQTLKTYVYQLKYAKADTIAKILTSMVSHGASLAKSGSGYNAGLHPTPNRPPFVKSAVHPSTYANSIGGGVSLVGKAVIIPDKNDNSLIIETTPAQYHSLINVIKKLDLRRKQVFVQVIIAEVNLQKTQEIGTQYYGLKGNMFGGGNYDMSQGISDFLSNPFSVSGFIAGTVAGSMTLPIGPNGASETVPSFAALFRLIATNSAINVLSAPDLLTLDNQKAAIMVGENVPFITSNATSQYALQNIVTQVQRQNVGIKLEITPTVNSDNYLSLKIYAKISAIIPSPDGLSANLVGPTTSNRYIKTTVLVKNNQMVIIGGLIQNSINNTTTGIPFLEDIPLLGYLFKDKTHQIQKDNLVILISPKIISSAEELLNITNKRNRKFLQSLKKDNEPLPGAKKMIIVSPKYVNKNAKKKYK